MDVLVAFIIPALVGISVGILSGLLGVGGGTVLVPIFRLAFGMSALGATATSLFTIVPTSISGVITHVRKKTCIPALGIAAGLGGAITSPVGVWLASISPSWLIMLVAALIIGYSAINTLRKAFKLSRKNPAAKSAANHVAKPVTNSAAEFAANSAANPAANCAAKETTNSATKNVSRETIPAQKIVALAISTTDTTKNVSRETFSTPQATTQEETENAAKIVSRETIRTYNTETNVVTTEKECQNVSRETIRTLKVAANAVPIANVPQNVSRETIRTYNTETKDVDINKECQSVSRETFCATPTTSPAASCATPTAFSAASYVTPTTSPAASATQAQKMSHKQLVYGALIGLFAGLASGYVGVGGGFIMVPLMLSFVGIAMKQASGTSLIAVAILAVPGVVSQACLGNIDYLAGIAVALGSIPGATIGARLVSVVPERELRFLFGGFLIVAAVLLALNEFGILG